MKPSLIGTFKGFLAYRSRNKLRAMMRGYRKLRDQDDLSKIQEIKAQLSSEKLDNIASQAEEFMFGASIKNAELITRQYLHAKLLLGPRFNKQILLFVGKGTSIKYPLPRSWQKILASNGYRVNFYISYFLWLAFLVICFSFGVYRALSSIIHVVGSKSISEKVGSTSMAYFNNMQIINLPLTNNDGEVQNIFTWYMQWEGRNKDVSLLCHDVKNAEDRSSGDFNLSSMQLKQLALCSIKSKLSFSKWFIVAILICIKDVFLFRWHTLLLFDQFIMAAMLRYADEKYIAKDYLFHNSCWVYRPIWTYEAERHGSRILFYFYSTNIEALKTTKGYPSVMNGWDLSAWRNVLVWDECQAEFVRRSFHSVDEINVVGQIWFSSAHSSLNLDEKYGCAKKGAIFDVQPHRASSYQMLGILTEYYSSEVAIQFLKDIHMVLDEYNIVVLHKRKRKLGNVIHPKYISTLEKFNHINHVSVDPELSANYIIDKSDFVISMPFTSTALLGRELDKPSIYYDPFGDIQSDDRAAHKIPIVTGVDKLREWIRDIDSNGQ